MGGKKTEACGRCAMSAVVDVSQTADTDGDSESRDPFGAARIEVDEHDLRTVSVSAWLGGVKRKLDELATSFTYGGR